MSAEERVRDLVAPVVAARGLDLYDVELTSGILRVTVDRKGGADVDAIGEVSQSISRLLDEQDVIADDRYLLEVSSPGIERRLRTRKHFEANTGTDVRVRLTAAIDGTRRFDGKLVEATESGVVFEINGDTKQFSYEDISDARTIFDWSTAFDADRDSIVDVDKRSDTEEATAK